MLDRIGDEVARATSIVRYAPGGVEILVVTGAVRYGDEHLCAESWLRFPATQAASLTILEDSILWVKRGHLPTSR